MPGMENQQKQNHAGRNILTLRRALKLTQKGLIDAFLCDGQGRPLLSVATLSGAERGKIPPTRLVRLLARASKAGEDVFYLPVSAFEQALPALLAGLERSALEPSQSLPLEEDKSVVKTIVRELSDYLTSALIEGTLEPGHLLPSDRQLSLELGYGRTPVREALKVLDVLGLIQIRPGKGTVLSASGSQLFQTPLSWPLLLGQGMPEHIVDVRNVLECESAYLAAQGGTEENLRPLALVMQEMEKSVKTGALERFLQLDMDFHLLIAELSQNPIILSLLETSRRLLQEISKSGMRESGSILLIHEEHRQIFLAIEEKDAKKARKMMRAHLSQAKTRYTL